MRNSNLQKQRDTLAANRHYNEVQTRIKNLIQQEKEHLLALNKKSLSCKTSRRTTILRTAEQDLATSSIIDRLYRTTCSKPLISPMKEPHYRPGYKQHLGHATTKQGLAKIQWKHRPFAIHYELSSCGGFAGKQRQHNGKVTHNRPPRPHPNMLHRDTLALNCFMGSPLREVSPQFLEIQAIDGCPRGVISMQAP
jgi:hypothetical protein